ncbi:MAG: YqhA family protein [Acidimicrobiaceae bacterium]|nr:YqhA family protein [Acidimicrobiaceae bacterium]HRA84709.1 YqhA family protein [Ilumatobacteraceae bacterium]
MPRHPVQALLNQARYLVLIAVAGLTVLSVATFAWAIAKTVKLFGALLDGGWRGDVALVDLLGVIEMYLLAIVQLIVAIGLYELFVGDLDVPNWLEVTSLDDLKKSIVDVLVVFLGVKGIEGLVEAERPLDALMLVGATAALIVALSLFRMVTARAKVDKPAPD